VPRPPEPFLGTHGWITLIGLPIVLIIVGLLASGCTKQNTLKCYSGEIGKHDEVPCPVPNEM